MTSTGKVHGLSHCQPIRKHQRIVSPRCFSSEYCQVPDIHFGAVRNHLSKSYVVPGTRLDVRCDTGYHLNLPSSEHATQTACHDGAWSDRVRCVPDKWLRHIAGNLSTLVYDLMVYSSNKKERVNISMQLSPVSPVAIGFRHFDQGLLESPCFNPNLYHVRTGRVHGVWPARPLRYIGLASLLR